jgi:fumarylacetoacetase
MTSPAYANHFSERNIPFGIASSNSHADPQAVTRIGNSVIFLHDLSSHGVFSHIEGLGNNTFNQSCLNEFAATSSSVQSAVRDCIRSIFRSDTTGFPQGAVEDVSAVTMHLPVRIGDFLGILLSISGPLI